VKVGVNISGELAKSFDKEEINSHVIKGVEIPLRYHQIKSTIEGLISEYSPEIILCTGIAPTRGIRLEINARNLVSNPFYPYNDGAMFDNQPLEQDGPKRIKTRLPVEDILLALSEKRISASISKSAGAFGCNQIFYHVMYFLERTKNEAVAGFIHIPDSRWNLAQLRDIFQAVLKTILAVKLNENRAILGHTLFKSLGSKS
jgi:pyroglutamyl-peptidase